MGRLLPSHPIARFAPAAIRDHIDVCGSHLFWDGPMRVTKHTGRKTAMCYGAERGTVSRIVWSLMTGEDLPEELVLVHLESCIHDRCVAPDCHQKMTVIEAGEYGARLKKQRAVS